MRYVRGMPGSTADDKRRRHAQRPAVHRLARLAAYPRSSGRRRRSGCAAQAARFLRGGAGGGGGVPDVRGSRGRATGRCVRPRLLAASPSRATRLPNKCIDPTPRTPPPLPANAGLLQQGAGQAVSSANAAMVARYSQTVPGVPSMGRPWAAGAGRGGSEEQREAGGQDEQARAACARRRNKTVTMRPWWIPSYTSNTLNPEQ